MTISRPMLQAVTKSPVWATEDPAYVAHRWRIMHPKLRHRRWASEIFVKPKHSLQETAKSRLGNYSDLHMRLAGARSASRAGRRIDAEHRRDREISITSYTFHWEATTLGQL